MKTITRTEKKLVEVEVTARYFELGDFLVWLLNKDVLSKFIDNIGGKEVLKEVWGEEKVSPGGLISGAFTWEDTDEGHAFWNRISDEWRDYVQANNMEGLWVEKE